MLRLHVPSTTRFLWAAPFWSFLMDTLKDRMGVQPVLPVKVSVIIDTMLNFDGDFDEHGDGKQTMILCSWWKTLRVNLRTTHNFTNLDGEDFHN